MPVVAAAATAFGSWAATTAAAMFASGTLTNLLTSVAFPALSTALQRAQMRKQRTPGISTEYTTNGGTRPQSFVLGLSATSGHMVCPPMSHGKRNKYLTYVIDLGNVPGQQIRRVIVDDKVVTFAPAPASQPIGGAPPSGKPDWWYRQQGLDPAAPAAGIPSTPYGRPAVGHLETRAWLRYYDGTQTAADPYLLDVYGPGTTWDQQTKRPWTADMAGLGTCYAILTFLKDTKQFAGLPQVRIEMEGIPLYDPRKDGSAGGSGSQRWADPTSWAPSTNAAVIAYNVLRGIPVRNGLWGVCVPGDALPLSVWAPAMAECEALVDGKPRWQAGIEVTVDSQPLEVLSEILKTCGGQTAEIAGTWKPRIGPPAPPVFSITDDDLITGQPATFTPHPGIDDVYNGVTASYPEPENLWEAKDAPPRFNADYEAADGGRRRVAELSLPACPWPGQVQRVMRAYVEEERRWRRHVLTLPPDALILEPLDTIVWTSAENGYDAKLFEVRSVTEDPSTGCVTITVLERDPSDYDWQPGYSLPTTAPGIAVPVAADQPPQYFTAEGIALTAPGTTTQRVAARLRWGGWGAEDDPGAIYEIRRAGTVVIRGPIPDASEGEHTVTSGILPLTAYEARISFTDRSGKPRAWTGWAAFTTPAARVGRAEIDDTPPAKVTGLTLATSLGSVTASWAAVADAATYELEITEAGANPVTASTPQTSHRWPASANLGFSVRVRAVDRLGNRGLWSDPATITSARDTTPPAVPATPTVKPGFGTLWIKWPANTEADLAGYEVYLSTSTTAPTSGTAPSAMAFGTTQVFTGLPEAVAHYVWLRAFDTSGNRSAWSARASGTTASIWQTQNDPAVPAGLSATSTLEGGQARVSVAWLPGANTNSVEIGVSENGGGEVILPAAETPFSFRVMPGTALALRIRGLNTVGKRSAFSAVASHTAARDTVPPAVPAGLKLLGGIGAIWGSWTPNTDADLAGYEVYLSASASSAPTSATAPTMAMLATTFTLAGLGAGAARWAWLRAVDTSGNRSAWSAPETATTGPREALTSTDLAGLVDATSFAMGIEPIRILPTLPATRQTAAVYVGNTLYRWSDAEGRYTASTDATQITGKLVTGQIASGAIGAEQIAAGAVSAGKLAVMDMTNLVPDADLQDPSVWHTPTGTSLLAVSPIAGSPSTGALVFSGTTSANAWNNKNTYGVTPGDEHLLSFWTWREGGTQGRMQITIKFLDKAGAVVGSATVYSDRYAPANTLLRTTGTMTVPPGAVRARLENYFGASVIDAPLYVMAPSVRLRNKGELIVDGAMKANHLATNEAVITGSAQIAAAIITDAHVVELNAAKLKAGTAITGSLTVDGRALQAIGADAALGAQDPALRINAGSTRIDPGRIVIAGTTTLADWRRGGDETRIDGGNLSANTVQANALTIGNRAITLTGVLFEHNKPSTNKVSWTAGTVEWVNDAGVTTSSAIAAGSATWSSGVLYIYWIKAAGSFSATTSRAAAVSANTVCFATYEGGLKLDADYGRTVVDGDAIKTGTITATQLIKTAEVITESGQIKAATITDAHVVSLDASKLTAGSVLSGEVVVNGRALASMNNDTVVDDVSVLWDKIGGPGSASVQASGSTGLIGGTIMDIDANGASHWLSKALIPFDARKLYKITFLVRRLGGSGTPGLMYLGLRCFGYDKTTPVARDGTTTGDLNFWVAASGVDQDSVDAGSYVQYVAYVKGVSADSAGGNGSIAAPLRLQTLARYIKATALFNHALSSGGRRMGLGYVKVEALTEEVADLVNAGETRIDPGMIRVSGGTTLADWRRGGDETRIDGGALSANTVTANKLEIGSRNITLTGVQFEHNSPSTNKVSWTAGAVRWVDDAGNLVGTPISAGSASWSSGVLYIYWVKGAGAFSATTSLASAMAANNVCFATYEGGTKLDADFGRTVVDGSEIKTGTITATQLIKTAALITDSAQIQQLTLDTLHLKNGTVTSMVSASAGGRKPGVNPFTQASGEFTVAAVADAPGAGWPFLFLAYVDVAKEVWVRLRANGSLIRQQLTWLGNAMMFMGSGMTSAGTNTFSLTVEAQTAGDKYAADPIVLAVTMKK